MVVLDTCAVIELCLSRPSLSAPALKKIGVGAFVLSVSFAEIALKVKRGKLILDVSPQALVEQYLSIPTMKIVDIGYREWFDAIDLEWFQRDPADRLLVGYASRNNLPIVTTDRKIKTFYKKVLW